MRHISGIRRCRHKPDEPTDIETEYHTMKRDGICFGCGRLVGTGTEVYRIDMLAGKSNYINLCGKCQDVVSNQIRSHQSP